MKTLLIIFITLIAVFIISFLVFEDRSLPDKEEIEQFLSKANEQGMEKEDFSRDLKKDTSEDEKEIETRELSSKELSLKIGQMLMIGFRGTEVSENSYIVDILKDIQPGGVIFYDYDLPSQSFPRNIINPLQTKTLISELQKYSKSPLFIAVDAEGGEVNRLKPEYGFSFVPSAEQLGRLDNLEETEKASKELAKSLSEMGFNVNFAPVVDVNINSNNPIIGALGRSFSTDPEKVFKHANVFIEGHDFYNIITAIKHFPGHGSSLEDSHLKMPDVTETYQEQELLPYKKLISQGFQGMVMTAHIMNKNIDPEFPATLSSVFLGKNLRKELGFNSVIISDDMHMGAILNSYNFEEAIIRAVQAGVDILLISNNVRFYDENVAYQARDALVRAVEQGVVSEQRIVESYDRIMALKQKYNLE